MKVNTRRLALVWPALMATLLPGCATEPEQCRITPSLISELKLGQTSFHRLDHLGEMDGGVVMGNAWFLSGGWVCADGTYLNITVEDRDIIGEYSYGFPGQDPITCDQLPKPGCQ
ncbi:hypothetical protein thsps21_59680 [Pseudomonas sp. No.21]|uniref:hypothetical protein n=1 Tax=Pseudomonas tohonis TaxID=2725477 RepID=UPI001F3091AB|nr:hypothetical protein [Pseudomonas tohonis]GJN50039.1 hypothetical protein TUM20249_60250 [Pseudomonas tohonis]